MRTKLWFVAVGLLLVAAAAKERQTGVFGPLKKGQTVTLKEAAGRYQIGIIAGVEAGHKVVEVGAEYIVLEDAAGVTETRIPVYAAKCVTVTRIGEK